MSTESQGRQEGEEAKQRVIAYKRCLHAIAAAGLVGVIETLKLKGTTTPNDRQPKLTRF